MTASNEQKELKAYLCNNRIFENAEDAMIDCSENGILGSSCKDHIEELPFIRNSRQAEEREDKILAADVGRGVPWEDYTYLKTQIGIEKPEEPSMSENKDSQWVSVEDRLPEEKTYMLIYVPDRPWISNIPGEKHKMAVAQFIRGKENPGNTITSADKHGNNLVPYYWQTFGPGSFFGQEVTHWMSLPSAPKSKREAV